MSTVTPPAPPVPDPYNLPPPWWQVHADWVWAVGVGILTAVLTVVSFPPYDAPEFAYALAAPAILWAYRRPRFRLYAGTLLVAQAVAWTTLLWWLHHVTWPGLFLIGLVVGAWVGSWYLAVWWAAPRLLGRPAATRLLGMLALASAWVLVEWTRTWLLGGFPWLPLAASQWQRTSLLQIAAFTGAYGVSFVLVAVNLGFAAVAQSLFHDRQTGWRLRRPEFLLALFLLMVGVSVQVQEAFNTARFSRKLAEVAFVQPYVPQTAKWDPARGPEILRTLEKVTLRAAETAPDFLVWPEASTPWAVRGDERTRDWIQSLDARARVPLVLGSIAIEQPGQPGEVWFNAMLVVTPDTGVQPAYYAKRHLVPFGEYVPLRPILGWLLSKTVPIGPDDFSRGRSAAPLLVPLRQGSLAVGPLICFEDGFPGLARDDVRAGAECLFVATNNAWYGEGGAAPQHAAHSVLRAVETRRPVLRCSNGGWSGWIDEFGVTRGVLTRDAGGMIRTKPGVADSTIYFRGSAKLEVRRDARWIGRQSTYTVYGDWFVAVCAVLAALGWLALRTGGPLVEPAKAAGISPGPR